MSSQIIVGLDVGTHSIKGVAGLLNNKDKYRFIKAFRLPSSGIRKGMIVDMEDATSALAPAIGEISSISRSALKNVFVNVGSHQTDVKRSKGFVVVSRADDVISQEDVERVIQASSTIPLPSNRTIVHVITSEFIVDGVGDIRDAVGLSGARLEVESHIVNVFSPVLKNLHKCAENAGFKVFGAMYSPLAASHAVLTKNQKDLGVILVDLGASTTGIAVFEDNKLLHTKVFPIGASHITNDLAIGLKVPVEVAENLKLSFGFAQASEVSRKESIDLAKLIPNATGQISRRYISEIIETRLAELIDLIQADLKSLTKAGRLPGGVVLVGGGAKLPGIVDLFKQQLRLPAQIGMPVNAHSSNAPREFKDFFEDPDMALAFGLFTWGAEGSLKKASSVAMSKKGVINFLKQFLP